MKFMFSGKVIHHFEKNYTKKKYIIMFVMRKKKYFKNMNEFDGYRMCRIIKRENEELCSQRKVLQIKINIL